MDAWEKMETIRGILSDKQIVDTIVQQFSTDQLEQLVTDICWEHDIDLYEA